MLKAPLLFVLFIRLTLKIGILGPLRHFVLVSDEQADAEHEVQVFHGSVEGPFVFTILVVRLVVGVSLWLGRFSFLVDDFASTTGKHGWYATLHEVEVVGTEIASGRVFGYHTYGTALGGGYGYYCIVDHGIDSQGRSVTTLYAHCSKMFARVGQTVVGGKTVLAQAGSTGNVTGPHLHFEVRLNGKSVDPLNTYVSPKVN
jgi:hypothetical protein